MSEYYLLALDRTEESDTLVWWRPARVGCTDDLREAGRYSDLEARSLATGCNDPVPVAVQSIEQFAKLQVIKGSSLIAYLQLSWRSRR